MARLGQLLREAREKKGSSWEEIEAATGLWPDYVRALEAGKYGRFASIGHLRSALRLYARYLELDVKEVLALWQQSASGEGTIATDTQGDPPRVWYWNLMIALMVTLTVGVLGMIGLYGFRWMRLRGIGDTGAATMGPGGTVPVAAPTPVPSPTPYSPISSTDLPRYTITATLDYAGHGIAVEERIDYANRTGSTLSDIVLNVFPNHQPGVFSLQGLYLEFGKGRVTTGHSLEGMTLHVPLPSELESGQVVTLFLDFELDLSHIDPDDSFTRGSLGWSDRVMDVGHWYPALAPLLPDGSWYSFDYHYIGDPYVMEEADYDVRIQAADDVTVAGGGELEREGNSWHFRMAQARSFAFAASDEYVSHTTSVDGVAVTSYYFPEHEGAGLDVARLAGEALETFEEEFGVAYPYQDYRVAETEFAGGMEFSGLSFLGSLWYSTYAGGVRSQLVALAVHEVSHQWWYGVVGSDQVREPWLDEAMATFSELIFYEQRYPHDELWLWDFEVLNWPRGGPIDGSIYDYADEPSYMNAVYRTGALFLADLRQLLGYQQFGEFLQEYCRSQSHKIAGAVDFFSILSGHTDQDVSPLLEEYFAHPPVE